MKTEQSRDDGLPTGWLDANTPTCRIKRIRKREGRCYELAMRGCLQAPEWELVHGECNGHPGAGTIGHAWLEFDGEAYCPVLDKTMPIGDFLRMLGAQVHARYMLEDAICLMLRSGHYGPWNGLRNSELAHGQQPLAVEIQAG